jgi:hypothetical protein
MNCCGFSCGACCRHPAKPRMAMVKLSQQIATLRQAQRNLEAVVAGEDPACGPQGGISFVTG